MPQRFAHLTDPHLSDPSGARAEELRNKRLLGYISWRRRRRFRHRREVLDAMLADLRDRHLDQVVVTGDLTHIGLPGEFRQALDWLRRLGEAPRVAVVPGNHDAYVQAPPEQTFALWREYLSGDVSGDGKDSNAGFPSLRRRGRIAYIGVNTSCPTPPFAATGRAGPAQLERLGQLLNTCGEQGLFRVVYLHHCPLPGVESWRRRLGDAPALVEVLREHGAELVLHGHGHRVLHNELEGPEGSIPVLAAPSASSPGEGGAEPAAWHLYEVDREGETWTVAQQAHVYRREAARFEAGESRRWTLRRRLPPPAPGNP